MLISTQYPSGVTVALVSFMVSSSASLIFSFVSGSLSSIDTGKSISMAQYPLSTTVHITMAYWPGLSVTSRLFVFVIQVLTG